MFLGILISKFKNSSENDKTLVNCLFIQSKIIRLQL